MMHPYTNKDKHIVPSWRANREDTKVRRPAKHARSERRGARRQIMNELQLQH